jgi:hypothetical protein
MKKCFGTEAHVMRRVLIGSAMGALTLLGAPLAAQSAPCVTAPISVYTTAGFSCQVGSVPMIEMLLNVSRFSVMARLSSRFQKNISSRSAHRRLCIDGTRT